MNWKQLKPKAVHFRSVYQGNQFTNRINTVYYTHNFSLPIVLNSLDFEVAVISLETFYFFPNITEGLNNVFAHKDSSSKIVSVPTGSYEIADIASEIKKQVGDDVYSSMALERHAATL